MPYRIDDDTPAACKTAKALLHNSSACLFVADVNGVIRWANRALLEWSHYTTKELEGIPWIDSSNEGVRQLLDGHVSIHSARRYLSPSSEKPVLCDVHLCRHPIAGDPLAILGTIQPIPSDATPALEEAMRAISEMRSVMAEHVGELRNLQESMRDEDATFIVATMRWCKRHPRVALVIFLMLLSAFGANNMLELAQRLYQIGVPVPEAVKQTDALQFPIAEPIAVTNRNPYAAIGSGGYASRRAAHRLGALPGSESEFRHAEFGYDVIQNDCQQGDRCTGDGACNTDSWE